MRRPIEIKPYAWSGPYSEWRSDALHDAGLCADVRAAWMRSDERLILRTCEMIGWPGAFFYDDHLPPAEAEGRGRHYRHTSFQWDTSKAPGQLSADCSVEGKGQFMVNLRAEDDYLDIHLSIKNDMSDPIGPIDWAFCVIGLECASVLNPEQDRTYIFDGDCLRSFAELSGAAEMRIYPVAGGDGFIPDGHKNLPRGATIAQESVVVVESLSGRYAVALGFDQSYNAYGCTGNRCFHMDPYFGTMGPGDEKQMHGRLYLIESNAEDAFQRYRQDFLQ